MRRLPLTTRRSRYTPTKTLRSPLNSSAKYDFASNALGSQEERSFEQFHETLVRRTSLSEFLAITLGVSAVDLRQPVDCHGSDLAFGTSLDHILASPVFRFPSGILRCLCRRIASLSIPRPICSCTVLAEIPNRTAISRWLSPSNFRSTTTSRHRAGSASIASIRTRISSRAIRPSEIPRSSFSTTSACVSFISS